MGVWTEDELKARIAKVDAAIDVLLMDDGASGLIDYSADGVTMTKSARLDQLRNLRADYMKQLASLSGQEITIWTD